MRKYYYYVYILNGSFANGICYSDSGEFELVGIMENLRSKYGKWCIIHFWHEISCAQYEKLNEMF